MLQDLLDDPMGELPARLRQLGSDARLSPRQCAAGMQTAVMGHLEPDEPAAVLLSTIAAGLTQLDAGIAEPLMRPEAEARKARNLALKTPQWRDAYLEACVRYVQQRDGVSVARAIKVIEKFTALTEASVATAVNAIRYPTRGRARAARRRLEDVTFARPKIDSEAALRRAVVTIRLLPARPRNKEATRIKKGS